MRTTPNTISQNVGTATTVVLARALVICLGMFIVFSLPMILGSGMPGDMNILLAFMSIRQPILTQVVSVLTFMGSAIPTLLICIALSLLEWRRNYRSENRRQVTKSKNLAAWLNTASFRIGWQSLWPLIAYSGAMITDIAMRVLIQRYPPQVAYIPTLLPELQADFQRYAYPSGHAVTVVVTYTALALTAHYHGILRRTTLIFSSIVIAGVGIGRLYLGVHWPSDVFGGYLLAVIWLLAAVIVTRADNTIVRIAEKHGIVKQP